MQKNTQNPSNPDPLSHIVYVSIPEDWNQPIGDFLLDPSILLPVETSGDEPAWDIENITWEAIISGMLKILAYDAEHKDSEYFRSLVLAVKPELPAQLSETGVIKARNRDLAIAEEIFRALKGLEPAVPSHTMNLALVCEQRADAFAAIENSTLQDEYTKSAFSEYFDLFQMDEVPLIAHINAGFFYARHYDFDRALHHLHTYITESDDEQLIDKAAKLATTIEAQNLQDNRFSQAYQYINMGNEEQGIEAAREFIKTNPSVWNAWFLLGWGLRRIHRYAEAAEAFEKSADLNDEQPDTFNELAICYMEIDEMGKAHKALQKALSLEPENTKIISNMGILALKTGQNDHARGFFETVLDYDPDDAIAAAYLEHLKK